MDNLSMFQKKKKKKIQFQSKSCVGGYNEIVSRYPTMSKTSITATGLRLELSIIKLQVKHHIL